MLPVRILARHEPDDVSTKWIYASCYPVRDYVNQFFNGRYDYLDGIVDTGGCEWVYNAFEVAMNTTPSLKTHYIFIPRYPNAPTSPGLVVSELKVMKKNFEEWTGREITDESLDHAIEVYNKNRNLLMRISELRRAYGTPLLGSVAMQMLLADQVMDKAEMNIILEAFLAELQQCPAREDCIRLMIIGSETWNTELEEMAESLGANVVVDELDNGTSYFWNTIYEQKDRLLAIALRYLGRPHSALRDNNWRRRSQHVFELAEDYMADGVLIVKQIYCVIHGTDNYAMWKLLRERNIPYHFFERDTSLPEDETRQRLESFINMLKPGLVRLRGWHEPLVI
jgi:benzoyl-CoA reductase subunit C